MTPGRPPADHAVRERVTSDLGTTFLLEAGAGTGKTRVLVDRYVRCVLDPERGSGDVRTVAAITFTEKAAGELRQRVREDLEGRAAGTAPGSPEAEAVERALEALDEAPISTIHSFAGRLLRELPVEAGIDPAFEQLDQLGGELQRARLWDEWVAGLAVGEPGPAGPRAWLSRLLRAGVRLADVRELAIGAKGVFGERYDVDPAPPPESEPEPGEGLAALAAAAARLRELCAAACLDASDKGLEAAMTLVEACERLVEAPPDDADRLAAALYALKFSTAKSAPGGRQTNWDPAYGGKEELQARFRAVAAEILALRDRYAGFVTGLAVAVADAFARWAGATQIELGLLDFTDLLGRLRDLLRDDLATRGDLQQRFRYILVDEFQDTDPLQAEIVFLLCEREPRVRDWREAVLEPGKLFVVGDPKQSIYRFRRADIGMYDEVRRLVAGQPGGSGVLERIRQNFRTTPTVVEWVNGVFGPVFDLDAGEGRQPEYGVVEPYRPWAAGPKIVVMDGGEPPSGAGATGAMRRDEARALAWLLRGIGDDRDGRWLVQDRDGGAAAGAAEPMRPARWGDIALLVRTMTDIETYEDALRDAGVPYRVEGGKTYFQRREVADALLCLRVAADPSDGPAVYGALHSVLFGFSDDELFRFSAAGGRFDLFAERQPQGWEAVAAALATLRELHEGAATAEPHELVVELVSRTRAAELLAATGAGAAQALANLDKLVERARAFAAAGGGGLRAFLAWAAQAGDTAGEQESQVDDEGDVVRLLTIHRAKGLEYPIVVLVGGARKGGGGNDAVRPIVDRAARRVTVKLTAELPGRGPEALEPQAYAALKDHEAAMAASELRRLLYVAATRARDRLVIPVFGTLVKKDGEPLANVLLAPISGMLAEGAAGSTAWEEAHEGVLALAPGEPPVAGRVRAPDAATLVASRGAWLAKREALLAEARRPARATSPSGLEHVDEEVRSGGPGAPPGRATALVLGTAVHRVMQLCDLADEGSLAPTAAAVARELGRADLEAEVAALAAACWRAAPVRAAAAAAAADPEAVHRELPVGALIGGAVVSGSVDLLYRDGGEWVVVDYKTDRAAAPGVLLARYRPQGAAYAVAVEAALAAAGACGDGGVVREVVFVAARSPGADGAARVVAVPVDDELRALAGREIGAAVAGGRAISEEETQVGGSRT